jgi:Glucodextranase, domain B
MKLFTVILFVILLVAAVVGIGVYSRSKNTVNPAVVSGIPSGSTGAVPETAAVSTPLPTVAQISLRITSPANGSTATSPSVVVRGVTVPKADVFVNDSEVTADAGGNFSAPVTLDDGDNSIVIIANDASGSYAEQEITVTYNPGQ